ncbi:MAG: ankyrin repeat domain-containing protein [Candidatus Micrarchaeota archaeon]
MGGTTTGSTSARFGHLTSRKFATWARLSRGRRPGFSAMFWKEEPLSKDVRERIEGAKEILGQDRTAGEKLGQLERLLGAIPINAQKMGMTPLAACGLNADPQVVGGRLSFEMRMDDNVGRPTGTYPVKDGHGRAVSLDASLDSYHEAEFGYEGRRYLAAIATVEVYPGQTASYIFSKEMRDYHLSDLRAQEGYAPIIESHNIADAFADLRASHAKKIRGSEKEATGQPTKIFAQRMAEAIERAANMCGLGICVLNEAAKKMVAENGYGNTASRFALFGLIDAGGKVAPLIVDDSHVLCHNGRIFIPYSKMPSAELLRENIVMKAAPESFCWFDERMQAKEPGEEKTPQKSEAKDLNGRLLDSVKGGDVDSVRTLLEDGADPNSRDGKGVAALYLAVENPQIAVLLLDRGAEIDAKNLSWRHTALMRACVGIIKPEMVRILLDRGADPNIISHMSHDKKHTALDIARANFQGDKTEMLEKVQAMSGEELVKWFRRKMFGSDAMWNPERMRKLLEKGASPNTTREEDGEPILTAALMNEDSAGSAKVLIEGGANPDTYSKRHRTYALCMAIGWAKSPELARLLIEKRAIVNAAGEDKKKPLRLAFDNGMDEIAQLLRSKGARTKPQAELDEDLLIGAHYLNVEEVREALQGGADANARDRSDDETTAIIQVCSNGDGEKSRPERAEIAKMLIDAGADVNAQSGSGNTALSEACCFGHIDAVKLLLDAGADVNLAGNAGSTPLMMASHGTISEGHESTEIVQMLLEAGADVNAECTLNIECKTALMGAARAGETDIVRLLLEHGADLGVKNSEGMSAFDLAKDAGFERAAQVLHATTLNSELLAAARRSVGEAVSLIREGASVNARDMEGNTTLMVASSAGDENMARLLLDEGADAELKNKDGKSALNLAEEAGHQRIIELLREPAASDG